MDQSSPAGYTGPDATPCTVPGCSNPAAPGWPCPQHWATEAAEPAPAVPVSVPFPVPALPRKKNGVSKQVIAGLFVGGLMVIGAVSAGLGDDDQKATASSAKPSASSSPSPVAAPKTNLERAEEAIKGVKGATVTIHSKTKVAQVTFPIGDNLSGGLRRAGIAMDTFKIMKGFKDQGVKFKVLSIFGTFDMQDKYGGVIKDDVVYGFEASSATVNRINYANMATTELDALRTFADFMHLHSAFGWNG